MSEHVLPGLSIAQSRAIGSPCLLAEETQRPHFRTVHRGLSVILSLNSGYE